MLGHESCVLSCSAPGLGGGLHLAGARKYLWRGSPSELANPDGFQPGLLRTPGGAGTEKSLRRGLTRSQALF